MESTPSSDTKPSEEQKYNPVQEIADELAKLNIDYKAPGFKKEVAEAKFLELSEDNNKNLFEKQHYKKLYKLTKDHKFWET
jgi:hypothetical protein